MFLHLAAINFRRQASGSSSSLRSTNNLASLLQLDPPPCHQQQSSGTVDADSSPSYSSTEKPLLYLDAANYTRKFFRHHDWWCLDAAQRNIQRFCSAAAQSGWTVVAFLDQATMTKEARAKWRRRREHAVESGIRRIPQGGLRLVGEMFAAEGVKVHYSVEMDNDDTLARYAQADGASILSEDQDFLRYNGATYDIYKHYRIKRKGEKPHLVLTKQNNTERRQSTSLRELGPPPKTDDKPNPFGDCIEEGTYLRGNPSPLVELGNLHIHVRPLRAALYYHLKIATGVEEEFPVLNDAGDCVWVRQVVSPNPELEYMLFSPAKAVAHFAQTRPSGVSDGDWIKHNFALRAVIAEICCAASQKTLLETIRPLMARFHARRRIKIIRRNYHFPHNPKVQ